MPMRIKILPLYFALAAGTAMAQASNQQPRMSPERHLSRMTAQVPAPPEPLKISFGEKSSSWTVATLASLPHKTITVHNEHTKADETYSGVQVLDLLAPLGVVDKPHGKDLRLYVVATGSDAYEAVYSIGEVTPDVGSSTVIVADTENGRPLTDDGPLKIVTTGDKRPARWVRNLMAIRVMSAN